MTTTIVAGYDGSPASETAVRWAAAEADRLRARLRLVYAIPLSLLSTPLGVLSVPLPTEQLRGAAERLLAEVAHKIREAFPELSVDAVVNFGRAAPALLQEATDAAMVVVGSRGLGEFRDLAMGSVSAQVATHAPCPVVVVPPHWRPGPTTGRIVVGVDGSKCSLQAIEFALDALEEESAASLVHHPPCPVAVVR